MAATSHTSLPSQNGPMVWTAAPRSWSSRPSSGPSRPTPKSKPSRTKNSTQARTTTENQKVINAGSSVDRGFQQQFGLVRFGRGRRGERLAGQVPDEAEPDGRDDAVDEREAGQRREHLGAGEPGGDAVRHLGDAEGDPR